MLLNLCAILKYYKFVNIVMEEKGTIFKIFSIYSNDVAEALRRFYLGGYTVWSMGLSVMLVD